MKTDQPLAVSLLPCPFCGGQPKVEPSSRSGLFGGILCDNIDCPVNPCVPNRNKQQAIAAWNTRLATRDGAVERGFWPLDTWDRRDDPVLLLVDYSADDADHPLEDAELAVTIGHNDDHHVGDDEGVGWQFAGWCWTHDHYVEGKGKVIGWLPITPSRALLAEPAEGEGK